MTQPPLQPNEPGYGPNVPVPHYVHPAQGPHGMVPAPYGWGQQWHRPPAPTSGLYLAAAIINWVTMGLIIVGTLGFGIIVAAWFIPMTIYIHKGAKDRDNHTALAVCTLLFCNLISGILMLVDSSNRHSRPSF